MQATVSNAVMFSGVGLHSGAHATIKILPAPEGHGLVFRRTDFDGDGLIVASYKNVSQAFYSTVLTNKPGASISTIEHLMAAICACKITNLLVEVNAPEIPIMDGAAEDFLFGILAAGIRQQQAPRRAVRLEREIFVKDGEASILARPTRDARHECTLECEIDFTSRAVGVQRMMFDVLSGDFAGEIASAKTFATRHDVEMLRARNMAKGGGLHNAIIFDDDVILNDRGTYRGDDFVRHKILDFIGDYALAGCDIYANFTCTRPSHKLNNLIIQEIFSSKQNYTQVHA